MNLGNYRLGTDEIFLNSWYFMFSNFINHMVIFGAHKNSIIAFGGVGHQAIPHPTTTRGSCLAFEGPLSFWIKNLIKIRTNTHVPNIL